MQKYINPYTDFGFKKLFGEEANKDLLIDFLNAFLPEKHRIKTLNFRNTEQLGLVSADRKAVFDIFCEAENGEKFIVEMQKAKQRFFKDRAVFSTAYPILEQAGKGDGWQYELQAVYFIGILDFEYDENEERRKFLRDIALRDVDGELFYDKLRYIILQMPLFTKTESELENQKDKWLYFLKNLTSFDQIPAILSGSIFERVFATAAIAGLSKQEYQRYYADRKIYFDNNAALSTAQLEGFESGRAKGLAEGLAEGLEQGRAEGQADEKIKIARNMMKQGFTSSVIAKVTGLSVNEIKKLN